MADVVVTLTGDEQALLKAMNKIVEKQRQLDDGFGKNKKASAEAADAATKGAERSSSAFSVSRVAEYAAGVVSVTSAIQLAAAAWGSYRKAQDDALSSLRSLEESDRKLAQVATSAEELAKYQKQADDIASRRGISRAAARDLVFQGVSDGFLPDVETVAAASSVLSVDDASIVAGQTRGLFKNDQLSAQEALSMTLKAAAVSRLDFGPMARALPAAAEGTSQIGGTASETLATLAVMAGAFKSGDTAADRLKAFGSAASLDPRLKDKGLLGAFDTVAAMPEEERAKFLGEGAELNAAYSVIARNRAQIGELEKQIAAERGAVASGGGTLAEAVAAAESNDSIRARIATNAAEVREQIAREERFAVGAAENVAAQSDAMAEVDRRGVGLYGRFATEAIGPTMAEAGASASTIAATGSAIGDAANYGSVSAIAGSLSISFTKWMQSSDTTAAAAEKTARNLERSANAAAITATRGQAATGPKP